MLKPIDRARRAIQRLDPNNKILDLSNKGLNDKDIEVLKAELKGLSGIIEINLERNNLYAECIPHLLEAMPQLWGIDLSNNHLKDPAIPELLKFKHLRKLFAAGSGIKEAGAKILLEHCHFTQIDISGSGISSETKAKLKALMTFNSEQELKQQMSVNVEETRREREKFIADNWEKHVFPHDPIAEALNGTYKVWTPEAIADLYRQHSLSAPPHCLQFQPKKALTLEQKAQKNARLIELKSRHTPQEEPPIDETKISPK